MNQTTDTQIVQAFERLKEAFPNDPGCQLFISPNQFGRVSGDTAYGVYLPSDLDKGMDAFFHYADSPASAVEESIQKAGKRDPIEAKRRKVAELEAQIAKLQGEVSKEVAA